MQKGIPFRHANSFQTTRVLLQTKKLRGRSSVIQVRINLSSTKERKIEFSNRGQV